MTSERIDLERAIEELVRGYGSEQVFGARGPALVADVVAAPGAQSHDVTALRAVHGLLVAGSADLADWQLLRANPTVSHLPEDAVAWASVAWRQILGGGPSASEPVPAASVQPDSLILRRLRL